MASVTFSQLLRRNKWFRRLFAGQLVSELGNWFNYIAELGLARSLSGSALAASGIIAAHLIPFCLLGPIAGAAADRFSRRSIMIWADIGRAVVALGFLFVTSPDRLWIAYVCAALISSLTAFFDAAKTAAMPNLARDEELLPANALMHASRFLQMSIGVALGALAADSFGYQAAFGINAASFLVSLYYVARIPGYALEAKPIEGAPVLSRSPRALVRDIREALQFVRATPLVLAIMGLNIGWALGGGMMPIINDRFGGIIFASPGRSGDQGVAILSAAAGLGLALGMLASRHVSIWVESRRWIPSFMGVMIAISGLVFAVSGFATSIWLMAALFVINRFVLSAEYAVQETILMNALPDSMRGKVFTIDRSIEVATMAISAIIGGALFSVMPAAGVPVIAGLLMASPGIVWLVAHHAGRFRVPATVQGRYGDIDSCEKVTP